MRTVATFLFLCIAAAAVPLTTAEGRGSHEYVRIGKQSLRPSIVRVSASTSLGWLNDSSRIARVRFAPEVAKRMVCESETSFSLTGLYLESRPIRAQSFASLCQLKPGAYTYEVELTAGAGAGGNVSYGEGLQGRIIVE